VIEIGFRLEGLTRNASTHAAGVVIAPDDLANHVPLLRLSEGEYVTQFDMNDVEAVGLLKFDFLGLRNLTLIDETLAALRKHAAVELHVESIPLDDDRTFALLRSGRTAGIFQLEGSGMTGLIRRVQPDRFEDLIALLALYRPGPLESGMTDEYVERRSGRKRVTYPHPNLAGVLADTYGLPIYQDQLMLMAQKLAGFSLAEADVLRKAMGKKKKDIMASLREKFIAGCRANGLSADEATATFDDMEKFSRYGFNKSHTTAYAFVSYWTAYLKANHPTHFMASLLTSVGDDSDKVAEYVGECREMAIDVLPPDINESFREFAPVAERQIRFGLGAVKHVGKGAISAILSARDEPFHSFFDFCRRVDGEGLDREALEAMIKVGAFDRFGASRRGILRHVLEGLELIQVARRERTTGQRSMFDDLDEPAADPPIVEPEFDRVDLLAFEREILGLYLSAHPLDDHRDLLATHCLPLRDALALPEGASALAGGRVKRIRRIDTKRGDPMAFLTLEDGSAEAEMTVFPRVLEQAGELLCDDALIGVSISVGTRNGEVNLIVEDACPLSEVAERRSLEVTLRIDGATVSPLELAQLVEAIREHPGGSSVEFELVDGAGCVVVAAGSQFSVRPCEALRSALSSLAGVLEVSFGNGRCRSRS